MTYNSLQGIFTTMIGFVTWPPFCTIIFYIYGGQVTKPIIVVKMPCKLLYVIQVKGFLIKCLFGIRVFGRLYLWLLIVLALFLQPSCFV